MEIVERKKRKKSLSFVRDWPAFILFGLGVLSVFLENAFLFNPVIIVLLYFSLEKSLLQYLFTFVTMSVVAFFIHPSYGLELVLISFALFLIRQIVLKMNKKTRLKHLDLLVFCTLLTILMCIKSWSFLHLGFSLLSTGLSFIWVEALNQMQGALEDEEKFVHDETLLWMGLFVFILMMVHPILGFLSIRLLLLWIPKDKKMLLVSLAVSSAFLIIYLYQYPLTYACMIIIPSLIASLYEKKKKMIIYFLIHFILLMALDPLFYTNGLFYQGLVAGIIYLMLYTKVSSSIDSLLHKERYLVEKENKEREEQIKQSITYLYDYISAMDFELGKEEKTPVQKAKTRVYKEVCSKCSHLLYCPLTKDLEKMVQEKLTPLLRKEISRNCITPYKLTLAVQQSSAIFLNEENYYQECLRRKQAIVELVESLKIPLVDIKEMKNNHSYQKEKLIAYLEISNIPVEDFFYQKEKWIFITKEELNEEQENKISLLLLQTWKKRYQRTKTESFPFSKKMRYVFEKEPIHQVSYWTYQKGCAVDTNGDQIKILQKETQFIALLCDGMGHDKKAERTAKSLLNSFLALYQHSPNVQKNLDQLNRLFRISLDGDNYSTFDFFHIDLQSLELMSYKGGSCPSYILRKGKLFVLPNGGLPLGLLDEIEIERKSVQLEREDILLITSDGISDFIQEQNPIIFQNIKNKNEFFRNLFQLSLSSMKHFDDATMIVCEIL